MGGGSVLGGQSFAAHAIPNGAFAGAAGAGLLGLNVIWGLVVFGYKAIHRINAVMASLASKVTVGPNSPRLLAGTGSDQKQDPETDKMSPLLEALDEIVPDNLSPKQALEALYRLKLLVPGCADGSK